MAFKSLIKDAPKQVPKILKLAKRIPGLKLPSFTKDVASRTIKTGKIGRLRISKDLKNVYGTETNMRKGIFQHAMKTKSPQGIPTKKGFARGARETVWDPKLGKYTARKSEAVVRGGLSNLKSWDQIRVGKRLTNVLKQGSNRKLRTAQQTVDRGVLSEGYQTIKGHHALPIELGEAVTTGMKSSAKNPFWKKAEELYPNIFSGDHWANLRLVPEGDKFKHLINQKLVSPHKQTHEQMRKIGFTASNLKKLFKGKNEAERLALLKKIDHKMKRMDQWIFLRMKKWKSGEETILETLLASDKIKRKFPKLSKAERRLKIKELLKIQKNKNIEGTQKAQELFSGALDKKALDSIIAGTGKTLGGN